MDLRRVFAIILTIGMLGGVSVEAQEAKSKSKYEQLIEKKKKLSGMWTVYYNDQQLLVELSPTALKQEYFVLPSISRGISRGDVLGGMSWGFGDDVIYAFQATEEKVFVKQRNVRFTANANSPEANAVKLAYSDSILHALPILTKSPSGGILLDMTRVFMNDDQQIGRAIGSGFRMVADRSTFSEVKQFSKNLELELNAVYAGQGSIDTVPNASGVQVGVHFSISVLPPVGSNGYKPRLADDRVGYFLTAIKDFSDKNDPEHFRRYINRWDLQKLDSSIDLSPPKAPIRFYMENTVPVYLRPTVEAGIMEWNKAYEKLGYAGAIRVDQQPADPNFDPESIEYNTFRWITAEAGFAMGPSRVDPRTGQILDADIIFDASFLDGWNHRWEVFRPEDVDALFGFETGDSNSLAHKHGPLCRLGHEMQRQSALASAVFLASGTSPDGNLPAEFIHQGLKEVVMHEVGHTLGLRHNFKASTWKTLEDISNPKADKSEATVASVMDYSPANVVVDKDQQGLYYSQTIGPYDYWAIEYGYKPISGNEAAELKKIASRSGEPALDYGTDEDTRSVDPDPASSRFDLGKDPLEYVRRQMEQSQKLLPKVVDNTVKDGDGYQRARQAFGLLLGEYWNALSYAARYPGGVYVHRDHKGDENAQPPFELIAAEKQREAMKLLTESAFSPPEVDGAQLNFLSPSRWRHWGISDTTRLDYPIHDIMMQVQDRVLVTVLNPTKLERILDNEFKSEEDDVYTLAEHMQMLVDSIFTEFRHKEEGEFTNREPLIDSFRRNLQRSALKRMASIVSHGSGAPSDARTLSRMHLNQIKKNAAALLKNKEVKLDDYSKAHLQESISVIDRVLDAELSLPIVY